MKNKYLQIENRSGKLNLNDEVNKDSADALISELDSLYGNQAVIENMKIGEVVCSANDALDNVEVEINSGGGSVFEGQRIYNALRGISSRGVEVKTVVNGIAASMGSVILMAGDTRSMTQGSRIMIHEASTKAQGDARELQRNADLLESISAEIAEVYAERSGGDAVAIRELMLNETWMTANEAKESGFIQAVIKDGKEDESKARLKSQLFTNQNENMGLFKKDTELKDKLEISNQDLADAEAKFTASQDKIKTLTESVVSFKDAGELIQAQLDKSTDKVIELEASLKEEKAKTEKAEAGQSDFDLKVSNAALAKLAEMGTPEPATSEDHSKVAENITRAEFGKLKPQAKLDFVNSGGRIK